MSRNQQGQAASYYAQQPGQGQDGDRGLGTAVVLGMVGATMMSQQGQGQGQQHGQGGQHSYGAVGGHGAGPTAHRAVLIGCNYEHVRQGHAGPLRGCHQDIHDIAQLLTGALLLLLYVGTAYEELTDTYRFDPRNIIKLQDDGVSTPPTISHVRHQIRQLVDFANSTPGESVIVFAFSGRGKQVKDTSGDEADGFDEAIVVLDDQGKPTTIVDDELHDQFALLLPARCKLIAVVDASASGTVVDLPYSYGRKHGKYENLDSGKKAQKKKRKSWFSSSKKEPTPRTPQAQIVLWAGCGEGKHAYEGRASGGVTRGHFANAFVQTLHQPNQSYEAALTSIDASLKKHGTDQRAQIATAHPVELRDRFTLLDIKAPPAPYGQQQQQPARDAYGQQTSPGYPAQQQAYPPSTPQSAGYPPQHQQGGYPSPQQGSYPPQGPGGFASPGYPPSNAAYPPSNPPYPPSNAPYPPSNVPYPPQGSRYPPTNAPYPPQSGQYPPQNAQGGSYPPNAQPGGPGGFVMPGSQGQNSWQGY